MKIDKKFIVIIIILIILIILCLKQRDVGEESCRSQSDKSIGKICKRKFIPSIFPFLYSGYYVCECKITN